MPQHHHVYSTLANDQVYTNYIKARTPENASDLPRPIESVAIKGGAGIASKHLVTPLGVHTKITDDELKVLEQNDIFQLHVKNGYIKVQSDKTSVDAAVSDMEGRDKSSPKVPQDYVNADPDDKDGEESKVAKPMPQNKKTAFNRR